MKINSYQRYIHQNKEKLCKKKKENSFDGTSRSHVRTYKYILFFTLK